LRHRETQPRTVSDAHIDTLRGAEHDSRRG
jgi:hypothetical protein